MEPTRARSRCIQARCERYGHTRPRITVARLYHGTVAPGLQCIDQVRVCCLPRYGRTPLKSTHIVDAVIRHPSNIVLSPLHAVVSITFHPRRRPGLTVRNFSPNETVKWDLTNVRKQIEFLHRPTLGSLKKPLLTATSLPGVFCYLAFGFRHQFSR